MDVRPGKSRTAAAALRSVVGTPSLTLAAMGLGVALASGGCPPSPKSPFKSASSGGVELTLLSPQKVPVGAHVEARPGDYLLSTDRVRVVVAARSPDGLRESAGALLDATANAWQDDGIGALSLTAEVGGRPAALILRSVHPKLDGERPSVLVVHETESRELRLETEIALLPGEPRVQIVTRAENLRERPLNVRIGDRVRWHGNRVFGPGVGFVQGDANVVLPWFARAGKTQSYALVFSGRPATVEFQKNDEEQIAHSPELVLGSGADARHERTLIVVSGPLDQAAEAAWRLGGRSVGWVEGRLVPEPAWAVVEARDAAGRIVAAAEAKVGSFRMALPVGRYKMVLRSPGGTDESSVDVEAERALPLRFAVPGAARLALHITDERDQPLAARVVVNGIHPTQNPNLGAWHLASGAANVAYTANGSAMLELPGGRYTILATRGPEYTIVERELDLSAEKGSTLRARLERVVDTRGWLAADFHLHADPSGDSEVSLRDRVTTLLAEGVELAAATDHNHITDYAPAIRELGVTEELGATTAVEITTSQWGHFNAYPYAQTTPLPPDGPPERVFEYVRREEPNAIIQVNHPRMSKIGYFNRADLAPPFGRARGGFSFNFDTLEVWNGFDLAKLGTLDENLHEWMELLARGRRYTAVGNSDAHRVVYEWAGYPRTYVKVADDRPGRVAWDAVTDALKHGRAIVTSGPFLHFEVGGAGPGSQVSAKNGGVPFEIEVRAPHWIGIDAADLLVNGQAVLHIDERTPGASLSREASSRLKYKGVLPLHEDAFVLALVRGTSPLAKVLPGTKVVPVAFTNPVFVDADGDGQYKAPLAAR